MSRIFAIAALIILSIAAYFSLRLAIADHAFRRGTPESVERALQIAPSNTAYLALRALQMEYDGQDPAPLLERAAALNPLASAPRIRLGLLAETRGDFVDAEKWLLAAAAIDQQYETRWTLANFYLRRDNTREFWTWMRAALDVSYGDRRSAFDLCWRAGLVPDQILERAIPQRRDVLGAYLMYLMNQHRDAVGPVALRLAALRMDNDTPVLEAACDLLIDAGNAASALEIWRQLGHADPGLLGNGDFSLDPRGHGFDWRPLQPGGVKHVHLAAPSGHRIILSGEQPVECDLLRHFVVLEPGKRYRLRWDARTQNLLSPAGVVWRAGNTRTSLESSEEWHEGNAVFTAPAGLASIALSYRRATGQPRAQGFIELRNLTLTPDPVGTE